LGIIVFIPGVMIAGILLPKVMKNLNYPVPPLLQKNKTFSEREMPNFGLSLLIPLIPALLSSLSTILSMFLTIVTLGHDSVSFFGSGEISLIIAIPTRDIVFGVRKGKKLDELMKSFERGLKRVATIIFILGAGGAFQKSILKANVGDYIA